MMVLLVGHSLTAERQRRFFNQLAERHGWRIQMLMPNFGTRVRGFLDLVRRFEPDWIYCQDELDGSVYQAVSAKREPGNQLRIALFHWQNLLHMKRLKPDILNEFDLHIAGCPGALRLLEDLRIDNVHEGPIPQVGVDCDLFKPEKRDKEFDTCTCAGFTVNKGVDLVERAVQKLGLRHLWLGKRREFDIPPYEGFPRYGYKAGWVEYGQLPSWLNKAKVHVLASRDCPQWKEQFTYSIAESLACGLYNVLTDAGEWPELWGGAPGVLMVPQGYADELKEALQEAVGEDLPNARGREFVRMNYSAEVIGDKLVRALQMA